MAIALTGISSSHGAVLGSNDVAGVEAYGSNSWVTFKALLNPANVRLMGFDNTNDLALATNAKPVFLYTIPLNRLRTYMPGVPLRDLLDPDPLNGPAPRAIVPIMVRTNVKSSMTLRFETNLPRRWVTDQRGQPQLIRSITQVYGAINPGEVQGGTVPFVVEIPVFDIWLIGFFNIQNELILRSTANMRLGPLYLAKNLEVTEQAFVRLAADALRYNGEPN